MNYNIQDFGAKTTNTNNASYIQEAINKASLEKGTIIIPKGIYKTSTIILKDNITLYLEEGAVLKALDDISLFDITNKDNHQNLEVPSFINCDYDGKPTLYFIYGAHLKNVTIQGKGTIDGNEEIFYGYQDDYFIDGAFYPRMPLLFLEDIQNLEIKEVTLANSAFWTTHMVGCENVHIHHIKIRNNLKLANCDGIDPDHCHHVEIHDCDIICADDAIVFKNTKANQQYGDCYNIHVYNCKLKSTSGAVKFGTESFGDFYNIKVEDVKIYDTNRGITMQLRDSGSIYDCQFKNIQISTSVGPKPYFWGYGEPLALTAINRSDDIPVGEIRNLTFENITLNSENGLLIYGEEQNSIHDISFKNLSLNLHNKSHWPKDRHDLRPYDKNPFIDGKVNVLYLRNAKNLTFNHFTYEKDASLKECYGVDFDIDNAKDIHIN
jgi:polygalacturonase